MAGYSEGQRFALSWTPGSVHDSVREKEVRGGDGGDRGCEKKPYSFGVVQRYFRHNAGSLILFWMLP